MFLQADDEADDEGGDDDGDSDDEDDEEGGDGGDSEEEEEEATKKRKVGTLQPSLPLHQAPNDQLKHPLFLQSFIPGLVCTVLQLI